MKLLAGFVVLLLTCSAALPLDNGKPRVFITDSQSWEISGGVGGTSDGFGGGAKGGARPQTAEIIKTFNERCPDCTLTIKKENADYKVTPKSCADVKAAISAR